MKSGTVHEIIFYTFVAIIVLDVLTHPKVVTTAITQGPIGYARVVRALLGK